MAKIVAFILFIVTLPLYPLLYILIKMSSSGPFIFTQMRVGKNKKHFKIYKFRTMVENAQALQKKYSKLNEAHGPAFKIRNDPRYTTVGKFLAHTALDELPQLINIMKGEMTFVGPRPFPVKEAENVPRKYDLRFTVLPGLTSVWVIKGSHSLSFEKWMELDVTYIRQKTFLRDVTIILKTLQLLFF